MNATLIVTTKSTDKIQVRTVPANISGERNNLAAIVWSENLFKMARSSDGDAARFLSKVVNRTQ
jgi:hypothetical protein